MTTRALRTPPDEQVTLRVGLEEVVFPWGSRTTFGSAAYWITQYMINYGARPIEGLQLGSTLQEEVAACLLGGYGIPAEVGLAAFERLRALQLIRPDTSERELEEALRVPLEINGRHLRYRFPRQRAARLSAALPLVAEIECTGEISDALALRDRLVSLPGIGPKTASWIARNHYESESIAVIDIHLVRAGEAAGFFPAEWTLPRDYRKYEQAFLALADYGGVPPSGLDLLIWDRMRRVERPRASLIPPPRPHAGLFVALLASRLTSGNTVPKVHVKALGQ